MSKLYSSPSIVINPNHVPSMCGFPDACPEGNGYLLRYSIALARQTSFCPAQRHGILDERSRDNFRLTFACVQG